MSPCVSRFLFPQLLQHVQLSGGQEWSGNFLESKFTDHVATDRETFSPQKPLHQEARVCHIHVAYEDLSGEKVESGALCFLRYNDK